MHIYDIYDDGGRYIYNIIESEQPLPDFVKTASFEVGETGRQDKKIFAWPENKRYPMDTPEDLYMSVKYFEKTAHKLPEHIKNQISNNLASMLSNSGLICETPSKTAHRVSEIPLELFAISIPVSKLEPSFIEKYANHIYEDHFVLYPLDTPENIKTANMRFPSGLDGDFKFYRPFIAKDIADRVHSDSLSPRVREYLSFSKTAAEDQLEVRSYLSRDLESKNAYLSLKELLDQPSFNQIRHKFANLLEQLDHSSGVSDYYESGKVLEPYRFLAGVYQEPKPELVSIQGAPHALSYIKSKQASLKEYYPFIENVLTNSETFQDFYDKGSDTEKQLIARVLSPTYQ